MVRYEFTCKTVLCYSRGCQTPKKRLISGLSLLLLVFCFVLFFFRFYDLLLQFNVLFLRLEKNTKMITGAHMAIK